MAEPNFDEKSAAVQLSEELKSSLDLIQDATLVHVHNNNHDKEMLSFSHIASPHMPPHQYLSEDEIDESDFYDDHDDYDFVNDDDYDDSDVDVDDNGNNEKIKLEVFSRPPSRLGRPLSNPYNNNPRRIKNGPSIDRIKMENAYLKIQNNKLAQELEQCRLTIQALKNIVGQKDIALQNSSSENQKAILQIRVLEALILSKNSRDGSVILRTGGGNITGVGVGNNNEIIIDSSTFGEDICEQDEQEKDQIDQFDQIDQTDSIKEPLKRKDIIPRKPVPQDLLIAPQISQISQQQQILTQPPILQSVSSDNSSSSDEDDLIPPPLPPKRVNRRNHIRRWSMDFGTNNYLGQEEEVELMNLGSSSNSNNNNNNTNNNISSHIMTPSDDNTIVSSSDDVPPSTITLAPTNNDDLQKNDVPSILKRRTGDLIQSLASCASSTKNGYDHSPPSTPSERGSSDSNESEMMNEKPTIKRRKSSAQQILRKIFHVKSIVMQ